MRSSPVRFRLFGLLNFSKWFNVKLNIHYRVFHTADWIVLVKQIVARPVSCLKILSVVAMTVTCGCGESQDQGETWIRSRCAAWLDGDQPVDRHVLQDVRMDSYHEEMLFLEKMLEGGFRFDWRALSGKRWSRTDSDEVQIDWFRNDSKLASQRWIGRKDRIDNYYIYFYLGRKCSWLDDVVCEGEQYIEVEFNLREKEISWRIGHEANIIQDDFVVDEIRDCMKEVWKLNGMNDKDIYHSCPLDRHEDFLKILLHALQINEHHG